MATMGITMMYVNEEYSSSIDEEYINDRLSDIEDYICLARPAAILAVGKLIGLYWFGRNYPQQGVYLGTPYYIIPNTIRNPRNSFEAISHAIEATAHWLKQLTQ